jgi:hypothetical protein
MRVVGALLAPKIDFSIRPARRRRGCVVVLATKALHRSPGFDQRAINTEVLIGYQIVRSRLRYHRPQQAAANLMISQSISVLGKARCIPDRIVHFQPDKPPGQQVVVELLHQLSFASDREENLQQQCTDQAFGRNRRAACVGNITDNALCICSNATSTSLRIPRSGCCLGTRRSSET